MIDPFLLLTAIHWLLLAFLLNRDRSRYRNCYVLAFALLYTVIGLTSIAGSHRGEALFALIWVTLLALLVVPFFLIVNGIMMIRREGAGLANLLSLGLGLIVLVGELSGFAAIILPYVSAPGREDSNLPLRLSGLGMLISVSVVYLSLTFAVFMLYCIFLQVIPRRRSFDYVIIHGAGLLNGERVSKLLSDRIDKAIEVYGKSSIPPIMIPSGGRGDDERISEAEAMERYLIEKEIPQDMIEREDRSTTTLENLRNSKAIIGERGGGNAVLVTSNYHVTRALRYGHQIGLRRTRVGSHVAFYYWPSALIREYVAIHAEAKHLVILLLGWLLCITPLLLAYLS